MWDTLTVFQKSFILDLLNTRATTLASIENSAEYERQHHELKLLRDRQILSFDNYDRFAFEPLLAKWLSQFYIQPAPSLVRVPS